MIGIRDHLKTEAALTLYKSCDRMLALERDVRYARDGHPAVWRETIRPKIRRFLAGTAGEKIILEIEDPLVAFIVGRLSEDRPITVRAGDDEVWLPPSWP